LRVISRPKLRDFEAAHPDSAEPLHAWWKLAERADWHNPNDAVSEISGCDQVGGEFLVFDIGGNKYRLVVTVDYEMFFVYIYGVYTHKEYDRLDLPALARRIKAERAAVEKSKKGSKN
jgi:mRNA interferase HigB